MKQNQIIAWNKPPSSTELKQHIHAEHLLVCLPETQMPNWQDCEKLHQALSCLQFSGANVLRDILQNGQTLWLLPERAAAHLHDYFGEREIVWQTQNVPQNPVSQEKMWFRQPEKNTPVNHVVVIGAGIAGASTAHELARLGVAVTVLEQAHNVAAAASGNRQGLLYAKISPHDTPQTELLLCAYGYARRLLAQTLPENDFWGASGVLHVNHNEAELQRNTLLSKHIYHRHLYENVSAEQANTLAGIELANGGLFWQNGVWLNPQAWINALLSNKNIQTKTNCAFISAQHDGENWQITTTQSTFSASHIVFCAGSDSPNLPIIGDFPMQMIRGQSSLARENAVSGSLKIALSGASYIAPAWNGWHTFGATFQPNDTQNNWRETDEIANQNELAKLNHQLHQSFEFSNSLKGHAAIRCDAHDHLPIVGALGDAVAMREVYAKLALDKNYRIHTPCPFYPNVFVNTAHGSRGLTTAPFCAAQIAAQIVGTPQLFSQRLKNALNPNRLIIRKIVRHET